MYKALKKEGEKMDGLWKGGKGRKEGKNGGRKEGPSLMTCNSIGIIVITTGSKQPAYRLYLSKMIFKDMLTP